VSSVGIEHLACFGIQYTAKEGNEHTRLVIFGELIIYELQHPAGILDASCRRFDKRRGDGHEQGGCNPFARYVADGEEQPFVVDQAEVVEIATDLAGGLNGGKYVQRPVFFKFSETLAKDTQLDFTGDIKLALDAFLGRRCLGEFGNVCLQRPGHGKKGLGKSANLIPRSLVVEIQLKVEIAPGHIAGCRGEDPERTGDASNKKRTGDDSKEQRYPCNDLGLFDRPNLVVAGCLRRGFRKALDAHEKLIDLVMQFLFLFFYAIMQKTGSGRVILPKEIENTPGLLLIVSVFF